MKNLIPRKSLFAFLTLLCFLPRVLAQNDSERPKPGAEHKKLEVMMGDWSYEGEEKPTPLGKGGRFSGKSSNRMVLDGFFLESKWEETNASGKLSGTEMHTYDARTRRHVFHMFDSDGNYSIGQETIEGNVMSAVATNTDSKGQVAKVKMRSTFAPDGKSIAAKWDLSLDEGKTWLPWLEFTLKKIGK